MVVIAVIAIFLMATCGGSKSDQAHLDGNIATGAILSGEDAVETTQNRISTDAEGDRVVETTRVQVQSAKDAHGVNTAGRSGLCALAGYSGSPECVLKTNP
jgi:hypothetical protein